MEGESVRVFIRESAFRLPSDVSLLYVYVVLCCLLCSVGYGSEI